MVEKPAKKKTATDTDDMIGYQARTSSAMPRMPPNRRARYGAPIGSDGKASQQLRELDLGRRMKRLNNWIRALALSWLAAVLFVSLPIDTPQNVVQTSPVWFSQILYSGYFLLFAIAYYGIRKRKLIYWKIIPTLLWIFLISFVSIAMLSPISLSLPWVPLLAVVAVFFVGGAVFCVWWQKQRGYFA